MSQRSLKGGVKTAIGLCHAYLTWPSNSRLQIANCGQLSNERPFSSENRLIYEDINRFKLIEIDDNVSTTEKQ
jgi:hypothetical protein